MRHEKIILDKEGNKLKIVVDFFEHSSITFENYIVNIFKCLKGKRTFFEAIDTDSYTHRALSMEQRRIVVKEKVIELIGKENYNSAVKECWELLEPKYV